MPKFSSPRILAGLSLLLVTMSASAVTLTTATGRGADADVNENPAANDGGSGVGTAVNARFTNLDRNEYIALRFDLGGYSPAIASNFSLTLINFRTNSAALTLRFYGVAAYTTGKDANSVVRGYTAENWNESDIRFSTLPGLDWDGVVTTRSLDLPHLTNLGALLHSPVEEGTSLVFSNAALTAFLRAHPTNVITFLVMRESTNGTQARFASREASATAAGILSGVAGDFAPRLGFDYPSSVAPAITGLASQTNTVGDDVAFTATVSGIPTPALQWRENGVDISGATNASLLLTSVQLAQNGYVYSLVASNSAGAATNSATLTVLAPPTPAFPGAEGAGAYAKGGRGGDVYYVTNLNDTGAGSLRNGISTAPAGGRTILFKVSGNIALNSTLTINKPRITIAGQTAPGDGICVQDYSFNIAANDIIVRHLRTRLGTNALIDADAMWIVSGTNVIVDHLSASWSVDETLSATRFIANLTVQNSFITESLRNTIHDKGAHGYGGIISSSNTTTISYHHNLYAFHDSRNPRVGADTPAAVPRLDFRNNVVYGWGFRAGYSGGTNESDELNYVNNYLIAGPSSSPVNSAFLGGSTNTTIYQSGNLIDGNKDGQVNGANTGWGMFTGTYTQRAMPFDVPDMPTDSAGTAYQRVVAMSGAMPWCRDAVDQRIIRHVRQQTGELVDFVSETPFVGDYTTITISGTNYTGVNPWPVLASEPAPVDADNDGMPNFWELALGLSTNNASDRNLTNSLGYTRLEDYLNWLADPHALSYRNGFVDLDLRQFVGGATNLTFTVASGTNGSVSLLGDGVTARFIATNNFSGLASFSFSATEPANGLGFGPVNVGVLITTTNAPNTPPSLATISNLTLIAGATLTFTNSATDNDVPAQTLTYSLLGNPGGATVTTNTGIFNWRPTMAQGGTSNAFQVVVTDSGTPALTATQAFSVVVSVPTAPVLQSPSVSGGQFQLLISGAAGPDYLVQASTNLVDWSNVTNFVSAALPFQWTDTNAANFQQRFYRVLLGP